MPIPSIRSVVSEVIYCLQCKKRESKPRYLLNLYWLISHEQKAFPFRENIVLEQQFFFFQYEQELGNCSKKSSSIIALILKLHKY